MLKKIYLASAGTGKTTTIVQDCIDGIDNKDELIEKLKKTTFITFSNAAADEIKSKLWKKIKEKLGENFNINEPIVFHIYTIHSFCLRIIKFLKHQFFLPSEIDFYPSDDKYNETLWGICVDKYFEELIDEEVLNFFKLCNDKNCKNFLKKYGFLLYSLNELGYTQTTNQENILQINEIDLNDFIDIKLKIEKIEEDEKKIEEINNEKLKKYFEYLNKNGNEIFLKISKEIYENIYLKKIYIDGVIDYNTAVFLVVKKIKEIGANDFFKNLKDNGWEIEEIFLDEAQDNDIIQNHLIIELAKLRETADNKNNYPYEPSLTIIGDYKQSIYQWRDSYPEEFKKIIEEVRSVDQQIIEVRKGSWRIVNERTLNYINKVFNDIANDNIGKNWFYNINDDALEFNNEVKDTDENISPLIKIFMTGKEKKPLVNDFKVDDNKTLKEWINEKGKKVGILTRARKNLIYLKEILKNTNVKYKIQESTTINELKDDLDNFYPEYILLKFLFLIFNYKEKYLFIYFLYFTFPGRIILEKFTKENTNEIIKDLNNFIKNINESYKYINEILDEYEYKKIVPAIYDIIKDKEIWKVMNHFEEDDYENKNRIIRQINSLLGFLYITENKIKSLPKQEIINIYLNSPSLPFEWFMLPEEIEKNEENIVEITTIHSAKGLTYDRVIILADFNKDFISDVPDLKKEKEQYNFLLDIEFNNILQTNPKIKINYFPYILIKKTLKNNKNKLINQLPDFIKNIFEKVKTKIHNEKLNLLYVALTRAKKDILMFSTSNNFPSILRNEYTIEQNISFENYANNQYAIKFKYKENNNIYTTQINPYYVVFSTTSQNKQIKTQKLKEKIGAFENYIHIIVGKTLHEIMRNSLNKNEDIEKVKEALIKDMAIKEIVNNIIENSKDEINKINNFKNKAINTETSLWSVENNNKFIHGAVDLFYIENDILYLYDYKTIFCDNKNEIETISNNAKENYKKQIEYYQDKLSKLFNINKYNNTNNTTDSLIFLKYIKENK